MLKVLLFANLDWYLYNFRLPLALALKALGHEVVLMSSPGKYAAKLQEAGFRFIPFPLHRRSTNPIREFVTLLRLIKIYRAEQPALVHHFTIKCVLYGSVAAKCAGIKTVINAVTGLGHVFIDSRARTLLLRQFVKRLYQFTLRQAQTVFQNEEDLASFVSQGLVKESNCHLIKGSGVDVHQFLPVAGKVPRKTICVLFAARLLWTKGLQELMEAADILQVEGDIVFKIAGQIDPGNPASVDQKAIERWATYTNVQLLGQCDDMAALFKEADIVVLPSYREGLPKVLLEAAACGLPLIASDVPGCREIVRHGENGYLIPAKDSRGLADAIRKLATNPALMQRMGARSRELVCAHFSQDQVIRETLAVYGI